MIWLLSSSDFELCVLFVCMYQEGTASVRFDSFQFCTVRQLIGSAWFASVINFPVRHDTACVFRTHSGSVRFGSVRFRVRFRPVPELYDSVRFVRFGTFGSVS